MTKRLCNEGKYQVVFNNLQQNFRQITAIGWDLTQEECVAQKARLKELTTNLQILDNATLENPQPFHGEMKKIFVYEYLQERTKAGLEAARARGRKGGRKKISPKNPKVLMAKRMHKNHGMSIDDICKTLNISRASFYRYLTLDESIGSN